MSADNWAKCPKCPAIKKGEYKLKANELHEAYGLVSREEYMKLQQELDDLRSQVEDLEDGSYTLREDYEFYGADTGVLKIEYSGKCQVCGLSLHFKDERKFDLGDEKPSGSLS